MSTRRNRQSRPGRYGRRGRIDSSEGWCGAARPNLQGPVRSESSVYGRRLHTPPGLEPRLHPRTQDLGALTTANGTGRISSPLEPPQGTRHAFSPRRTTSVDDIDEDRHETEPLPLLDHPVLPGRLP